MLAPAFFSSEAFPIVFNRPRAADPPSPLRSRRLRIAPPPLPRAPSPPPHEALHLVAPLSAQPPPPGVRSPSPERASHEAASRASGSLNPLGHSSIVRARVLLADTWLLARLGAFGFMKGVPLPTSSPSRLAPGAAPQHNAHLTRGLEVLRVMAGSRMQAQDEWRDKGLTRAIKFLSNERCEHITSVDQLRALLHGTSARFTGIGTKTLEKIGEILESGTTHRAEQRENSVVESACRDLVRVWGVGPATARSLALAPFSVRGTDDLRVRLTAGETFVEPNGHAVLSDDSRYCLGILQDLETRIPRDEVQEVIDLVRTHAVRLWGEDVVAVCCGSYRRGRSSCGDIDLLLTHRSDANAVFDLGILLTDLEACGFLTHRLKSIVDHDQRGASTEELLRATAAKRHTGGGAAGALLPAYDSESDGDSSVIDEAEQLMPPQAGADAEDAPSAGMSGASALGALPRRPRKPPSEAVTAAALANQSAALAVHPDAPPGVPYDPFTIDSAPAFMRHSPDWFRDRMQSHMLVCRLPPAPGAPPRLHRRLDIKFYSTQAFPFALLYFTGSDHFNRSLRHYVNQAGWSLSDHGLSKATRVMVDKSNGKRVREKVSQSNSIVAENEADIFRAIGVPYRPPWDRDPSASG